MVSREKIIEISLQQFLKNGIRKMSVQKLVEPLGVSTKTVYKFFEDKEDLLKQCLKVHYSELYEKFSELKTVDSDPVSAICNIWYEAIKLDSGVNCIFYNDLNYYYPELQDSIVKNMSRKFQDDLENLIEKGIQDHYFIEGIDPLIVTKVMALLYSAITRTNSFKSPGISPEVILKNTIELYIRGICTEKGSKKLNHNYSNIIK